MNDRIKEKREKIFQNNKNLFTQEEKAAAFDDIVELFYNSNFGSANKSDIELLMFHLYLTQYNKKHLNADGTLSYPACSDFEIAKRLGITPQKIRNLKVKQQLAYPEDYDWKRAFEALLRKSHYDPDTHKITIGIPDPNVYHEVQNFLESTNCVIERTLNSRAMVISVEYFLELAVTVSEGKSKTELIKELKKVYEANRKDQLSFDSRNIGKCLKAISGGVDIGAAIVGALGVTNPWVAAIAAVIEATTTIAENV